MREDGLFLLVCLYEGGGRMSVDRTQAGLYIPLSATCTTTTFTMPGGLRYFGNPISFRQHEFCLHACTTHKDWRYALSGSRPENRLKHE